MQANATHNFVATLSDGTVAAEHSGQWVVIDGERKPWVRLGDYLLQNGLHVTSLRYNANGTTYHAPKLDTRFEKGGQEPDWYSLEYIIEVEEGPNGREEMHLVDIGAYFGDVSVHQIIELGGQETSWVQLRKNYKAMAYVAGREVAKGI